MRISTSDACYAYFIEQRGLDGDGDPDLIGLFAYALVERDRLDWIAHRLTEGMSAASAADIDHWFSQKPPSFYEDKLKQAAARFDGYARGYLADEIEAGKKRAVRDAVGGFGNWSRGVFQGALGNVVFVFIVLIGFYIAVHNEDVIAWAKDHLK